MDIKNQKTMSNFITINLEQTAEKLAEKAVKKECERIKKVIPDHDAYNSVVKSEDWLEKLKISYYNQYHNALNENKIV